MLTYFYKYLAEAYKHARYVQFLFNFFFFFNADGASLSLTYFIQYDATFGSIKQTNTKSNKETKFIRTCAKKQVGQGKKLENY